MWQTKIESLTAAQHARLIAYRDEWLAIGRSVEAADRPKTEKALAAMYATIGKPTPRVWWNDGPATGSVVRTILRANLWANLWANLGANLGANLLEDNLWANLMANLWDNLRDNWWYFWGQHESAWSSFYNFPDAELRPMYSDKNRAILRIWLDLCCSAGWWNPHEGIVFVCERPSRQAVDERGRLHAHDGPAILCRDGWEVYAWHGVRVTEQIIMRPDTLTAEQILGENNAEVRRVMVERFGLDRFIVASKAKELDHHARGTLYKIDWQGDEPLVAVKVTCATTGQIYFLRVPPQITKADQAAVWTFGFENVKDYAPLMET